MYICSRSSIRSLRLREDNSSIFLHLCNLYIYAFFDCICAIRHTSEASKDIYDSEALLQALLTATDSMVVGVDRSCRWRILSKEGL